MTYIDINLILFIIGEFYFLSILDIFPAAMFLHLIYNQTVYMLDDEIQMTTCGLTPLMDWLLMMLIGRYETEIKA